MRKYLSSACPPTAIILILCIAGCAKPEPEPVFEVARVSPREIAVTVEAAGIIEPERTVEVKSKASGEILSVLAETGDVVELDALVVQIDKRTPRNLVDQAEAELVAARARRTIARTQKERAESLLESGTFTETDYEQTVLEFANAEAEVVSSTVRLENARIALEDTDVRAPTLGTIIEKHVEDGQVISSPTQDVGGGTLLMKMADLSSVRVRTLVDETDIGKIRPGMEAIVTVSAYPNQPFSGVVQKIEPQAILEQNVTMFAVMIVLENRGGLLLPGMNAEVTISIVRRDAALAMPTMALRTDRDIYATATMIGMQEDELRELLGKPAAMTGASRPAGNGGAPPPDAARRRPGGNAAEEYRFGADYWVLVLDDGAPKPAWVRTGVTDFAYSEVVTGLEAGDDVLLLPSSALFEARERMQGFMTRRFGSLPGMARQES